jgi:hypothetical protein
LLGSSGVKTSSFRMGSVVMADSIGDDEGGKSSGLVSAKVT